VAANTSPAAPPSVVVNGAEGEPGCFKDRTILSHNPYAVLEGALIAAHAVGAHEVIVALKRSFTDAIARVDTAMTEIQKAGWDQGVALEIFEGPSEYLYGEETALLESIDGRYPFPRVAPPFRRGIEELAEPGADDDATTNSAAQIELAGPSDESVAPPTLVDNVETMANVPEILAQGADWFRSVGTKESPGTIVVTITGPVQHAGVGEVAMGTTLREAIETIGGGAAPGRRIVAAMSGVSNALVPEAKLDTPLTYEAMAAAGSGLGAAGFLVFDDTTDLVGVAAGVSRFLAVESCGQCRHCKQDGLELADLLGHLTRSDADDSQRMRIDELLAGIAEGARCNLPYQQQAVVGSVLTLFADAVDAHLHHHRDAAEPVPIGPIATLDDDGARLDEHELAKQPDWTYDSEYSGQWPADRLDDHRAPEQL
jgi:NADH-quinone oxidoreductase subunit F